MPSNSKFAAALFAFLCLNSSTEAARLKTSHTDTLEAAFESFVRRYDKSYARNSDEYIMRRERYKEAIRNANVHNENPHRLWTAGINHLSDWTESELMSLRGFTGTQKHPTFLQQRTFAPPALPTSKLWKLTTTKRIRDQGTCGSCWAIAAATTLEAHSEIYMGGNRTISAQQLVSCTPNPHHCGGDGGCKGGTAELAMTWALSKGGVSEAEIPYTGDDDSCKMHGDVNKTMAHMFNHGNTHSTSSAAYGMTGWETLPSNRYNPLAHALVEIGPAAVAVAASSWSPYDNGIFNDCPKDAIVDHVVTAIGFGEEENVKYWTIQNSWSDDWGEDGIIRLMRHEGDNDYCGMNTKPWLGVGCKGETAPVRVCGMCGVLFDSVVPHFKK